MFGGPQTYIVKRMVLGPKGVVGTCGSLVESDVFLAIFAGAPHKYIVNHIALAPKGFGGALGSFAQAYEF